MRTHLSRRRRSTWRPGPAQPIVIRIPRLVIPLPAVLIPALSALAVTISGWLTFTIAR